MSGSEAIRERLDEQQRGVPVVGRGPCADALYGVLDVLDKWNGEQCQNRALGRWCGICDLRDQVRAAIAGAIGVEL